MSILAELEKFLGRPAQVSEYAPKIEQVIADLSRRVKVLEDHDQPVTAPADQAPPWPPAPSTVVPNITIGGAAVVPPVQLTVTDPLLAPVEAPPEGTQG